MATIRDSAGSDLVLQHMRILILRLSGRAEAAGVLSDVQADYTALRTAEEQYQADVDKRMALTNELYLLDNEVLVEANEVHTRALLKVKNDRSDPRYTAVFKDTPSQALRSKSDAGQLRYGRGILTAIAAEPDFASIPVAELTAALDAFEACHHSREAQFAIESSSNARRLSARAAAIQTHNLAEPRLLTLYKGKKVLVKSFFYQAPKNEKAPSAA